MNLQFTPDSALAGGLVLGSMVVAKRLNAGKNLGVSGETKAFAQGRGEATNASFLLGLVAAGYIAPMILGAQAAVPMVEAPRAIVAGALVGFGSALGCGCTSGHGISGNGQLRVRSMVYTCVFMVVGALVVAVTGTLDELHVSQATKRSTPWRILPRRSACSTEKCSPRASPYRPASTRTPSERVAA